MMETLEIQKIAAERRRLMLVTMSLSVIGGAEAQVVDLAVGLRQRGWEVEIVSLLPSGHPMADLRGTGVTSSCLEMRRGVPDPAALGRFIGLVRSLRPDIVHSHMTHPNLLARLARPLCPMPVLLNTLHGYKMYSVQSGSYLLREMAHRITDRLADITTVVCQAAADRYARNGAVSQSRLMVVPNGIRTAFYQPNETIRRQKRRQLGVENDFVWLAAGRLEKVKDYPTMLRGFAGALQAGANQVLLIAGGGSLKRELELLAFALGIGGKVRFLGVRDDIGDLLQAADAFVLSSSFEGLPLVLLEAGARGLPIVATRVGGNPEVFREGVGGYLVPAQRPLELGRAMERLIDLPAPERKAMGRAARQDVLERFCLEKVLNRWEDLYFRLMARKALVSGVRA
jgi:glycosyltransferase involved in cell wall biosynthesis